MGDSPQHPAVQGQEGDLLPSLSEQGLETTTHPHKSSLGIQDSGLLKLMSSCWRTLEGVYHFGSAPTLKRGNLPESWLAERSRARGHSLRCVIGDAETGHPISWQMFDNGSFWLLVKQ